MRRRSLLKNGKIDYSKEYFTIVSLADNNTIGWKCSTSLSYEKAIYISTDDGATWKLKWSDDEGTTLATLNNGDKMLVKRYSATAYGSDSSFYNYFTSTQDFDVEGNIMSMIINGDFTTATTISSIYTFHGLFRSCTKLKSAENLILPATTLANNCYGYMFYDCHALTTAPSLPATTLAEFCYGYMFYGCYALTTAPSLPATTLAYGCYAYMFNTCKSLTTAPSLPATALASKCYQDMFRACTGLTTAPSLPATTLQSNCYNSMFQNCTSLTTAPELSATTLADRCCQYMFQGCTSLTTAPSLPATTLASNCYSYMFYNCSNLNNITCLAVDISATDCTTNWVNGVASSGTFTKPQSTSWTIGVNGIPANWTICEYVEIGGKKWATMNVGANRITRAGLYFQWGDTQGYTADEVGIDKQFAWNDYKYRTANTFTKYNNTDGKTELEASDDAVNAAWGGYWRMPTTAEFQELSTATTSAWTANYEGSSVAGLVLTSKADSNVKLFFPAAGYAINDSVNSVGSYGGYWSSSLSTSSKANAYSLDFSSFGVSWQYYNYRSYGFPVRPVIG